MPRATSSATAPTPTRASSSPAGTPRSASPATTTSACAARCRSRSSRAAPRSPRSGRQETITRTRRASSSPRSSRATSTRQVGLYHASPRDPVWEYVLSPLQAELCLDVQQHRICLIGHSHVALSFSRVAGRAGDRRDPRAPTRSSTSTEGEWLINPGSVGQPRDGDPRAAWLELDTRRLDRRLPPHRVRHRRRRGGDPRGPAAGLAGRAAVLRPVRPVSGL